MATCNKFNWTGLVDMDYLGSQAKRRKKNLNPSLEASMEFPGTELETLDMQSMSEP